MYCHLIIYITQATVIIIYFLTYIGLYDIGQYVNSTPPLFNERKGNLNAGKVLMSYLKCLI